MPSNVTDSYQVAGLVRISSGTCSQLRSRVVSRPKDAKGFVLLPKRWVVERSNSWTMRARRNARDYERLMSHAEAHIQWAFITLMTRRLTQRNRRTEAASTPLAALA
ncbi:transposase [Streptomyces sp. NPDC091215]|uniref:transposase n=1 Tax=Streptomyces sp. NPDC091215 TaxID=3155192 RepID=UPI00342B8F96